MEIRPLTRAGLADLGRLLGSERASAGCWCMWFIIAVKDYHEGGEAANAAGLAALAERSAHPLGLLAYEDGDPVGWVAAGPRSRYARAVRTPTLKGLDPAENDDVWLVPCFFVRADRRGRGVARRLLEGAVAGAASAGARAVEGFPTAGAKRTGADQQVGTEALFAACGFTAIRRPSSNRVVMRLELGRA